MIGLIQSRIHCSQLSLLEDHVTAQAMWEAIWKEFDISRASEIGAMGARVISKSFTEFASIDNYYWAYLEAYDEITSRLSNKNGHEQQAKHYEVFL